MKLQVYFLSLSIHLILWTVIAGVLYFLSSILKLELNIWDSLFISSMVILFVLYPLLFSAVKGRLTQ